LYGEFPVAQIVVELEQDNLLPAILFRTGRKQCDLDVEKLLHSRSARLQAQQRRNLLREVEAVLEKYGFQRELIQNHPQYEALIETGAGAHHAGQLLTWRLLLEELMTRGVLRLMIATGTVAAGVDFPARTVIVTAHSKRCSEGFKVLSSSEFQQMSGRAGRRGKDTVGFCVIAPGPFSDARVLHEVAKRPAEPLRSAYYAAPATVLNLLKYRNVDDLRFTVSKSLAAFLDRKAAAAARQAASEMEADAAQTQMKAEQKKKLVKRVGRRLREADQIEGRQVVMLESALAGLDRLGYMQGGALTEKGLWAAEMCTTLVLELSESIGDFLLAELSLEELVGVVASIAGDSHRTYLRIRENPIKKEYLTKMQAIIERVARDYRGSLFALEVAVQPDAAVTALTWLESESWEAFTSYLRLGGVAEGDAARLISQTADHLHQISRRSETHPELALRAEEGRRRLLRPPITDTFEALIGAAVLGDNAA
jgi:ATP-dependent RNA helicase HelY